MYVKCCLPGKLIRNSLLRIFTGGWACRHPLPGMYQNLRLPEGKQVFIINRNVCTNSLDAVGHSCQGVVRTFLKLTFARASQGPASHASLSKDSSLRPAVLPLSCTTTRSESELNSESLTGDRFQMTLCWSP